MTDCPDADLRDLLPDYAHGTLTGVERARVDAHLATCPACRHELALVRGVRAARTRPGQPDIARIVAALPRPAVARHASNDIVRGRRRGAAARLPWRGIAGIAAVLACAVGIGLFEWLPRDGRRENPFIDPPIGGSHVDTVAARATASGAAAVAVEPGARAASAGQHTPARRTDALDPLGALGGIASDATEDELRTLIEELDSLSGIPDLESTEGGESAGLGGMER